MPTGLYHRSIFIWPGNSTMLEKAYSALNYTIYWCARKIDPGVFHEQTRFYVYAGEDDHKDVFNDGWRFKGHPNVAVIRKVKGRSPVYSFTTNLFTTANNTRNTSFVWKPGVSDPKPGPGDLFTRQTDFHNQTLKVVTMILSDGVLGTQVDIDATHNWTDFWGVEISLMKTIGSHLNLALDYHNPELIVLGELDSNGSWVGIVGEVAYGRADFALGIFNMYHSYGHVVKYSVPYTSDFLTFAAPLPRPVSHALALVNPLGPVEWAMLLLSVLVMPMVFVAVARTERVLRGLFMHHWDEPATAYKSIDTIQDIFSSGLVWVMNIYGVPEEGLMEQSRNKDVSRLWNYKKLGNGDANATLIDTYLAKVITVDWWSVLRPLIKSTYSTPDGQPLVHVPQRPIVSKGTICSAYFHAFVPWRQTVNTLLSRIIESGLRDKWSLEVGFRMKNEAVAGGQGSLAPADRPDASPMVTTDFVSAFCLMGLIVAVAVGLLVVEMCHGGWRKRRFKS